MSPSIILLSAFLAAFAVCMVVTPIVRALALRFGLVDHPDGRRKIHTHPIPVAGGLAVLISTASVIIGLLVLSGDPADTLGSRYWKFIGLSIAAGLVAFLGVVDDFRGIPGQIKFLGQLAAVAIVMAFGVQIRSVRLFEGSYDLGIFAYFVTAFWLMGAINSLNLIDGLDGLLGSVGCIICGSIAAMAFMNGQVEVSYFAIAMTGSLIGFLFFNFPPATIFLGDCGSMLIGLVVGVLAIEASLKGPATVALGAPAALLVIPIFDTTAAIIRRKFTGRSIYSTDRGHLHHVLLRKGLSNWSVLMLVAGLSLVAGIGALVSLHLHNELFALVSVLVVVSLLVVSRLFGYAEFLLVKERFMSAAFRGRTSNGLSGVHKMQVHLQGTADWDRIWKQVTEVAASIPLQAICLDVNAPALHEGFHARWGRTPSDSENYSTWHATLPVTHGSVVIGRMEFTGTADGGRVWDQIGMVGKLIVDLEDELTALTASKKQPSLKEDPLADNRNRKTVQPA